MQNLVSVFKSWDESIAGFPFKAWFARTYFPVDEPEKSPSGHWTLDSLNDPVLPIDHQTLNIKKTILCTFYRKKVWL